MTGITCAKCSASLPVETLAHAAVTPCPSCHAPTRVEVFPALFRQMERGTEAAAVAESDASCFYHPQKRAAAACESCGRFLCGLCDVELHGQHLCPGCLASGKKKGKLRNLERERVLYGNIALALALVPLLIWPFTVLTAPAAIFVAIRYWRAPGSIVSRSKARFVIAILFALAEIGGWITFLYFALAGRR